MGSGKGSAKRVNSSSATLSSEGANYFKGWPTKLLNSEAWPYHVNLHFTDNDDIDPEEDLLRVDFEEYYLGVPFDGTKINPTYSLDQLAFVYQEVLRDLLDQKMIIQSKDSNPNIKKECDEFLQKINPKVLNVKIEMNFNTWYLVNLYHNKTLISSIDKELYTQEKEVLTDITSKDKVFYEEHLGNSEVCDLVTNLLEEAIKKRIVKDFPIDYSD